MAERASSKLFQRMHDQRNAIEQLGIAVNHLNTVMVLLEKNKSIPAEGLSFTRAQFDEAFNIAVKNERVVSFKVEGDTIKVFLEDGAVAMARSADQKRSGV